jgi:hypothetical protein
VGADGVAQPLAAEERTEATQARGHAAVKGARSRRSHLLPEERRGTWGGARRARGPPRRRRRARCVVRKLQAALAPLPASFTLLVADDAASASTPPRPATTLTRTQPPGSLPPSTSTAVSFTLLVTILDAAAGLTGAARMATSGGSRGKFSVTGSVMACSRPRHAQVELVPDLFVFAGDAPRAT